MVVFRDSWRSSLDGVERRTGSEQLCRLAVPEHMSAAGGECGDPRAVQRTLCHGMTVAESVNGRQGAFAQRKTFSWAAPSRYRYRARRRRPGAAAALCAAVTSPRHGSRPGPSRYRRGAGQQYPQAADRPVAHAQGIIAAGRDGALHIVGQDVAWQCRQPPPGHCRHGIDQRRRHTILRCQETQIHAHRGYQIPG